MVEEAGGCTGCCTASWRPPPRSCPWRPASWSDWLPGWTPTGPGERSGTVSVGGSGLYGCVQVSGRTGIFPTTYIAALPQGEGTKVDFHNCYLTSTPLLKVQSTMLKLRLLILAINTTYYYYLPLYTTVPDGAKLDFSTLQFRDAPKKNAD